MISVESVDRGAIRDLILSMKGGVLSCEDYKALDACTSFASHLWIGYVGEIPVCAWGLVPPTFLSDSAYLWLYSTDAVDEYKFLFVRHSQLIMEEMKKLYPVIYGVCALSQPKSIRWIKWLGGEFGYPGESHIPFMIGTANG